jgi:hypothetical protein
MPLENPHEAVAPANGGVASAHASHGRKTLPEANEFSPGQVELRPCLELAQTHRGSREALIEAIRAEFFADAAQARIDPEERLKQQRTRAYNVLVGMKGYGLIDLDTIALTDVGTRLCNIDGDGNAAMNDAFAAHILRRCHGIEVLDAVRSLQARNEPPTKASLAAELESRGFALPRATTHHTKVLQWLREAGVINKAYQVDPDVFAKLAGVDSGTLAEWTSLSDEQRALILTLRRLADVHGTELLPAKDVVSQAKIEHGSIFREDQLRARVFRPLEEMGWIALAVTSGGRGGKSGKLRATAKLLSLDLETLPENEEWGIPPDLRSRLNTPLAVIYQDLMADDTHTKGIALELLAVRLATDLGLRPVKFRLRAKEATGGGEVDLIAEGVHLHFTRWLFQCKNTSTVRLADLAKEVGMAALVRPTVIVVVTTGRFAAGVGQFAREIEETENVQIVLVDRDALKRYRTGGIGALASFFRSCAEATMRQKRRQVESAAGLEH